MTTHRSDPRTEDVLDVLLSQHTQIRDLFAEVAASTGEGRRECFQQLVRLLAVHETAEEEVVHPVARAAIPDGGPVVDDRLEEEHEAKQMLERLDGLDPDDPEFMPLLTQLRDAVLTHARHEERYEFNWLKQKCGEEQLRGMAIAVRAAEATAPTHPHAGLESATANALVGPFAAVVDRARDAIRGAMSHRG